MVFIYLFFNLYYSSMDKNNYQDVKSIRPANGKQKDINRYFFNYIDCIKIIYM